MTAGRAAALVAAVALAGGVVRAQPPVVASGPTAGQPAPIATIERHHYSIAARIRPLLFFWIGRSGVGDAIATRRVSPEETTYTLLIGSDPERAPRRINRWGYIREDIRGADAQLIGLMTQSDEDSLEEAEANVTKQSQGEHPFKIIRATVSGHQAESVVTSIDAPQNYSFRQVQEVLELARREPPRAKPRVIRLPPGTRPGFLAALTDVMRPSTDRVEYVYHGRIYELRRTETRAVHDARVLGTSYGPAVAADFTVTSQYDGEQFRFSMTFGTTGRLAQVPLTVSYRPRWWMEVNLTLDERTGAPVSSEGAER